LVGCLILIFVGWLVVSVPQVRWFLDLSIGGLVSLVVGLVHWLVGLVVGWFVWFIG
jgi:hypothetical protein